MIDDSIKARVDRLLRGDFRVVDMDKIFLFLRFKNDGRATIKEIGDFVAHQAEREKGIITDVARDWFNTIRFMSRGLLDPTHRFDLSCMPENTIDFLYASVRRLDIKTIKRDTGIDKIHLRKIIDGIVRRFVTNKDGTLNLIGINSPREINVIKCLSSYIVATPVFTIDNLFNDFVSVLKSNSLITKENISSIENYKTTIAIYAVSVMHNCKIKIDQKKI